MMKFLCENKQSLYEELDPDPQPRSRKHEIFKYASIVIFLGSVCAILFLVFFSSSGKSGVPISLLPNAAVPVLLAAEVSDLSTDLDRSTTISFISPEEDILVNLDMGTVRGFKMNSRGGREFLAFRGIPYAKPPVGQLRFQPPEDVEPWEGILNATNFGPDCLQRSKATVKGSEDCLHLNVYTPKKFEELGQRNKYLPVMVYIHGGVAGGSSKRNSGEYFMGQDVVLVGFNYRVGILGNLNTNDSLARGNQGSRDQVKALEWVKANIRLFGGDRRKVTLFGNSYGAMGISTHLLSPMTKGLFHQVICQSGQAIYPDLIERNPLADAFVVGEHLECNATTTTDLVSCLRNADGKELVLASYQVGVQKLEQDGNLMSISSNAFTTTVDPPLENVDESDVYLPEPPLQILKKGGNQNMPAIFGVNRGEGLFQSVLIATTPELTKAANENWDKIMLVGLGLDGSGANEIVSSARDFYFGSNNITADADSRDNLTDLFSDRMWNHPAHTSAFYQKEVNRRRENVYLYYFTKPVDSSYISSYSSTRLSKAELMELAPAHADEVQFLFPYEPFPLIDLGSPNANFSQMMVRMWTNFAKTGKPGLGDNEVEWLPISKKPYSWFQLDVQPQMINLLDERMDFWDSFELNDLYF